MKVLMTIALLALSSVAVASDAPDRALAMKYLEVSKVREGVDATIAEYESQFEKKDATPEQKAKFHQLFESAMGWGATKDQMADLVMKVYTKQELEASIAFMSTPVGASITEKSGDFSRQWSAILAGNLKKITSQKAASSN